MEIIAPTSETILYAVYLNWAITESYETELLLCKKEDLEKTVAETKGKMKTIKQRELKQDFFL